MTTNQRGVWSTSGDDGNNCSPQKQTLEDDDDASVEDTSNMDDYEIIKMEWDDFFTMLYKRLVGPDKKLFVRALRQCENNERPIDDLLKILDFACRTKQERKMLYCHHPDKRKKEAAEDQERAT